MEGVIIMEFAKEAAVVVAAANGGAPPDPELKYKGVRRHHGGKKYSAEIRDPSGGRNSPKLWLGSYDTAVEAACVYDAAVRTLRPDDAHAKTNFSEPKPEEKEKRAAVVLAHVDELKRKREDADAAKAARDAVSTEGDASASEAASAPAGEASTSKLPQGPTGKKAQGGASSTKKRASKCSLALAANSKKKKTAAEAVATSSPPPPAPAPASQSTLAQAALRSLAQLQTLGNLQRLHAPNPYFVPGQPAPASVSTAAGPSSSFSYHPPLPLAIDNPPQRPHTFPTSLYWPPPLATAGCLLEPLPPRRSAFQPFTNNQPQPSGGTERRPTRPHLPPQHRICIVAATLARTQD